MAPAGDTNPEIWLLGSSDYASLHLEVLGDGDRYFSSKGHDAPALYAVLTEAADGISAARPGARRDVLESYIKRLAKLEEIAMSYKGVEMCYAIQAGRELRIMTKSEQISDLDAHQLAKDISKRIEAEMQYPGHIKVIVIRETRAVEVAK